MKKPSCFIQKKSGPRRSCPHCKESIEIIRFKNHIKTVMMVKGKNRCIGCKEHPNYRKNALKKICYKEYTFLNDHALPASANFYGSKTVNVSGI